jgi:hypothetical protein
LGLERLAEQDAVDAGDKSREGLAPLLERTHAQILAIELQKVEATSVAVSRPRRVSSAPKSLSPSGRNTTASPLRKARSAGRLRTASAIRGS